MLAVLTEEDLQALDKIADEDEAQQESLLRFETRAGMSPEAFAEKLRDTLSQEYLKKDNQA